MRLCRFARSPHLWAALACLALGASRPAPDLDAAEVALAALGAVDKLHFVLHVKAQPLAEVRAAELALFRRCADEAEALLLQAQPAPLVYRAVKLNVRAARWLRALEVAQAHRSHVDTVLALRARYLATLGGRAEWLPAFAAAAAAAGALPDWPALKARNHALKQQEALAAAAQQQQQALAQAQQGGAARPLGVQPFQGGGRGGVGGMDDGKDDGGFLG